VSGPHAEDPLYGATDAEVERLLSRMLPAEPLDPPRRGFHHTPPTTMPPTDDDEGPGADDGED
jgi:hypothetical protein